VLGARGDGFRGEFPSLVRFVRVADAGLRIVEVPITFVEREHGASKMSNRIIVEAFWRVAQWGVTRRIRRLSRHN
jgi:dolichol-phosphate mannosyltransferase